LKTAYTSQGKINLFKRQPIYFPRKGLGKNADKVHGDSQLPYVRDVTGKSNEQLMRHLADHYKDAHNKFQRTKPEAGQPVSDEHFQSYLKMNQLRRSADQMIEQGALLEEKIGLHSIFTRFPVPLPPAL